MFSSFRSWFNPAPRPAPEVPRQSAAEVAPRATPIVASGPAPVSAPVGQVLAEALARLKEHPLAARPEVAQAAVLPCPVEAEQARQFLSWLKQRYGGQRVFAHHLQDQLYPSFCDEKGWRPRPWNRVAKHLKSLTGGKRTYEWVEEVDGPRHRLRVYLIPKIGGEHGVLSQRRTEILGVAFRPLGLCTLAGC
jgi:hypothetical protein